MPHRIASHWEPAGSARLGGSAARPTARALCSTHANIPSRASRSVPFLSSPYSSTPRPRLRCPVRRALLNSGPAFAFRPFETPRIMPYHAMPCHAMPNRFPTYTNPPPPHPTNHPSSPTPPSAPTSDSPADSSSSRPRPPTNPSDRASSPSAPPASGPASTRASARACAHHQSSSSRTPRCGPAAVARRAPAPTTRTGTSRR